MTTTPQTVAVADRYIDRSLLHRSGRSDTVSVEASSAGLAPGEWPLTLQTSDTFGRPVVFERVGLVRRNGDVSHARYVAGIRRSPAWVERVTLLVWND